MVAMVFSISTSISVFLRFFSGSSIWAAPVSSITSMALSGSLRSLM
jgi:1,2-phenylacetyl-CoA epoxidase PaaB subunit